MAYSLLSSPPAAWLADVGRPQLELGTGGRVRCYRHGVGWRAMCLYRDFDGVTRQVQKYSKTKGGAEKALATALRDRARIDTANTITPDTTISVLAEKWYAELTDLSPSTMQAYRDRLDRQVIPALGGVHIRELTVGLVDRHLSGVKLKHGAPLAKMTKSVLSGMCGLATRHDAIEHNPCRDVARISTKPKRPPRSLSVEEITELRTWLLKDERARQKDLPDLVGFMLATGARVGEVSAVSREHLDLDAGTVEIKGTVVRIKGHGLIIKPTKTKAGERVLVLPRWAVAMLKQRCAANPTGLLFPTELGNLRDPSNTRRNLREAFKSAGQPGLTSHAFRKTVATLMDEAGLSARDGADQLGHAHPSQTMDRYWGRTTRDTGAASVLEGLDLYSLDSPRPAVN